MGLLFQPRWSGERPGDDDATVEVSGPHDRQRLFLAAFEAVVRGDTSRFPELFTHDVAFRSPHVKVDSLAALQRAVGEPEDSLTDIEIVVRALDAFEHRVVCEWRLEAMFTRPVLYDDRLLIEPTGGAVRLRGASVAEFRGQRISGFRHYFDDTELLAGVPGSSSHLRWRFDA